MCTGSGAGPVDAPQASTHIADPPHSAVGVGCDPFFFSGCCMAQRRFVVRAVALLSAKTK